MSAEKPGYCCTKAQLQFDWKLGTADEAGTERIMEISGLQCLNCGADYRFDTKNGTLCPVLHEFSSEAHVVLRVRQVPVVPQ